MFQFSTDRVLRARQKLCACGLTLLLTAATQQPAFSQAAAAPRAVVQPAQWQAQQFAPTMPAAPQAMMPAAPQQVMPVQYAETTERPLDSRIAAMPSSTEELTVIHHRSQLLLTRQPTWRISVTDPAVAEVVQYSPTEMAILGVGLGTTDVWLWFEESVEPLMYTVTVIRDPSLDEQRRIDFGKLERKLQVLYPNSKVFLIPLSRKIIVRGQARDAEESARIMQIVRDELINQHGDLFLGTYYNDFATVGTTAFDNFLSGFIVNELQVPGEFQVMLRVRIAELNRSQARQYGLDWDVMWNTARHQLSQSFAAAAPMLTGIFENGDIQIALEALASNGTAKILSDSSIVVLSGEPASFLAGGEFAVPSTVGLNGVGVATTTFRGFGTSLIATPTVVDHDLIRMTIIPELSEVDATNAVGGIPGVNVKRVQTRVELREGQTIVLGGMFERQQSAEVTRIPWLGEIPIVGTYLFNRKRATEDETELLIVVTPEIVRPMDAEEVPPMPGWYVTHPDDFDFCKYNRIEGNPDLGNYQLLPYGNEQGYAQDVGYNYFNAPPADLQIQPAPTIYQSQPMYGTTPYMPAQPMPVQQSPNQYQPAPGYPQGPQYQTTPPVAPMPQLAPPQTTQSRFVEPTIQQTSLNEERPSLRQTLFGRFRRK
jgi:pilus assembly protein CpaC